MTRPASLLPTSWLVLMLAGCAVPAPTGITRLGDGVMQARSAEEAESFCRTTGDPTRLLDLPARQGVHFRCD